MPTINDRGCQHVMDYLEWQVGAYEDYVEYRDALIELWWDYATASWSVALEVNVSSQG